ncbi:hypothetical protein HK101_005582, partial [Irineochytrium annulatum]
MLAFNGKKLPSPKLQKITDSVSGITWTPTNGDGSDTWVITLADGSSIHITTSYQAQMNWMDVSVFLAAGYYGKCGGKGDGLLHGLDGKTFSHTAAADIMTWGKTWEVQAGDSLFHSHYTPGSHTHPVKYTPVEGGKCPLHHTECPAETTAATSTAAPAKTTTTEAAYQPPAITTVPAVHPTSTAAAGKGTVSIISSAAPVSTPTTYIGTVTNPVTNNSYPIIQPPAYVPPTDSHVAAAESHCTEILTTGCEKVLPDVYTAYLAACVADILSTGSYIFCENTRRSYNQRCAKVLGQMTSDVDPTVAAAAAQ